MKTRKIVLMIFALFSTVFAFSAGIVSADPCVIQVNAGESIQAAIDQVEQMQVDDCTISVAAGYFDETLTVTSNQSHIRNLTIVGSGIDKTEILSRNHDTVFYLNRTMVIGGPGTILLKDLTIDGRYSDLAAVGVRAQNLAGGTLRLESVRLTKFDYGESYALTTSVSSGSSGLVELYRCIIDRNRNGVRLDVSDYHDVANRLSLINTTIANVYGVGVYVRAIFQPVYVTLINNIFSYTPHGIEADITTEPSSEIFLEYSDFYESEALIEGGSFLGDPSTLLYVDPLFASRWDGIYTLQPESLCINAGDPSMPPDPDGSQADMGALAFNARELLITDFETVDHWSGGGGWLGSNANYLGGHFGDFDDFCPEGHMDLLAFPEDFEQGPNGYSGRLSYAGLNGSEHSGGFWITLAPYSNPQTGFNATPYKTLSFYARGEEASSFPTAFPIQLKDAGFTVSPVQISGMTSEWKKFSIPLAAFTGALDLSQLLEFNLTLRNVGDGALLLDQFSLSDKVVDLTVADFNSGILTNNIGGQNYAFTANPQDPTQSIQVSASSSDALGDPNGSSVQIDYDVDSLNVAWAALSMELSSDMVYPLIAQDYKTLNLSIKGDPAVGYTSKIKIELVDSEGERSHVYMSGISANWKTFAIPLAAFTGGCNVAQLSELAVIVADNHVDVKAGRIYVDQIVLKPNLVNLTLADFNSLTPPTTNNVGGIWGEFNRYPNDPTQSIEVNYSTQDAFGSPTGHSIRLDYDVDSPNPAENGFWMKFGPQDVPSLDASGHFSLKFYLKGDAVAGFTNRVRVELQTADGRTSSRMVTGITSQWKQFSIALRWFFPLSDLQNLKQMAIAFDNVNSNPKVGTIYLDQVTLATIMSEIAPKKEFLPYPTPDQKPVLADQDPIPGEPLP